MAKISYANPKVQSAVTYNWSALDATLGDYDIGLVWQDAPGVGPGSGLNTITTSILPRPIYQPVLGQIIRGWEPTLGYGEFILLAVPVSTAIVLGQTVTWFSGTAANYTAVSSPTTASQGVPYAVCMSNTAGTSGGITSNASNIQYAWFQISGLVQTIKTAVISGLNKRVFQSGTAGKVMVTSSTGAQIVGARTANSTSAGISTALVWLDRCNMSPT